MQFQIRDDDFGLALYSADTAADALLDFLADQDRGARRPSVQTADDGTASLVIDGRTYRAVPPD